MERLHLATDSSNSTDEDKSQDEERHHNCQEAPILLAEI